jgi:hypothetical protein
MEMSDLLHELESILNRAKQDTNYSPPQTWEHALQTRLNILWEDFDSLMKTCISCSPQQAHTLLMDLSDLYIHIKKLQAIRIHKAPPVPLGAHVKISPRRDRSKMPINGTSVVVVSSFDKNCMISVMLPFDARDTSGAALIFNISSPWAFLVGPDEVDIVKMGTLPDGNQHNTTDYKATHGIGTSNEEMVIRSCGHLWRLVQSNNEIRCIGCALSE